MSFLDRKIIKEGDELFFTMGASKLPLSGYNGSQPKAGTNVLFGVRPAHVKLSAQQTPGALQATVDISETLGSENLLWLVLEGQQLSARIDADQNFESGDTVYLTIEVAKSSIFDKETQNRI